MACNKLGRPWTDEEVARILHMRDVLKIKFPEIDKALGRARSTSCAKYRAMREGRARGEAIANRSAAGTMSIPIAALADRDARARLERPTITAEFFGDPLPGRSALDHKRSMEAV